MCRLSKIVLIFYFKCVHVFVVGFSRNRADVVMKNMHQKHARTSYKHEFLLVRVRIYALKIMTSHMAIKYVLLHWLRERISLAFFFSFCLFQQKKNKEEKVTHTPMG